MAKTISLVGSRRRVGHGHDGLCPQGIDASSIVRVGHDEGREQLPCFKGLQAGPASSANPGDVDGRRRRFRLRFVVPPESDPRVEDMVLAVLSRSRLEPSRRNSLAPRHDACSGLVSPSPCALFLAYEHHRTGRGRRAGYFGRGWFGPTPRSIRIIVTIVKVARRLEVDRGIRRRKL